MKFKIVFKNPGIDEEAFLPFLKSSIPDTLPQEEAESLLQSKLTALNTTLEKYLEMGDTITVEFDTNKLTAEVLEL